MQNSDEALPPINFDKLPQPPQEQSQPLPPANSMLNQGYYGGYNDEENVDERTRWDNVESAPAERPAIVTIVAVINFIAAGILGITLLLAWGSLDDRSPGGVVLWIALQIALCLTVGIGLWKMMRWAYLLAIVGYGLSFAATLFGTFSEPITGSMLISLAMPVLILVFLLQSSVRQAFQIS